MHVLAVGIGRGEQRAEEAVEGGEVPRRRGDERQVLLGVVADREDVVLAGLQEAVHAPAVELVRPPPRSGRGRGRRSPGSRGQAVGLVLLPRGVRVGEPRLAPVGAGQPAEVVVEGAVLHHQHDDRVEREVAGGDFDPVRGSPPRRGSCWDRGRPPSRPPGHPPRAARLEELAAAHECPDRAPGAAPPSPDRADRWGPASRRGRS